MKHAFRSLAMTVALAGGLASLAQQPYSVTITGTVNGCTANMAVNITTLGGTQPAVDIDVPVMPPSCSFTVTLNMASQGGGFTVSTPCLGAIQSQVVQYQIGPALGDSAMVFVTLNCGGGGTPDCLGVPGGNAMPGTACTTALGLAGVWSADCSCVTNALVDCEGVPNGPAMPGTPCEENGLPGLYSPWCWCDTVPPIPDCLGVLGGSAWPGTTCVLMENGMAFTGTWTADCVCDTSTVIVYDCLQIANGPNMPGTPCTMPNGVTGIWSADCSCIVNAPVDCEGVTGGSALPGSPCMIVNNGVTIMGIWDANCECWVNTGVDCMGVPNGPNVPGSPCTDPATGLDGVWAADCSCTPGTDPDCEAGFFVMQAYQWVDSAANPNGGGGEPIPNQLWLWNLSTGNGSFQYLWSWGDGSASSEAYPTHTYSGPGTYTICLTIEGPGCTDTYCQDIVVDGEGILGGFMGEGNRSAFTVNVMNPLALAVTELPSFNGLTTWPNPAQDVLHIGLDSRITGNLRIRINDLSGRGVVEETRNVTDGRNDLTIPVNALSAGSYLITVENGSTVMSQRFVKLR